MPLTLESLDFTEVAREVLDRFASAARRAGSELRLDAPRPVPGRWDRVRLEQVFTELLSNALEYGAGKPVDVAVRAVDGSARLEVRDHGPGIGPESVEKIFERFGRSGPVSHYGGLGLYLCREAVEAHGGAIRFESTPGEGCTFIASLPLSAVELA